VNRARWERRRRRHVSHCRLRSNYRYAGGEADAEAGAEQSGHNRAEQAEQRIAEQSRGICYLHTYIKYAVEQADSEESLLVLSTRYSLLSSSPTTHPLLHSLALSRSLSPSLHSTFTAPPSSIPPRRNQLPPSSTVRRCPPSFAIPVSLTSPSIGRSIPRSHPASTAGPRRLLCCALLPRRDGRPSWDDTGSFLEEESLQLSRCRRRACSLFLACVLSPVESVLQLRKLTARGTATGVTSFPTRLPAICRLEQLAVQLHHQQGTRPTTLCVTPHSTVPASSRSNKTRCCLRHIDFDPLHTPLPSHSTLTGIAQPN